MARGQPRLRTPLTATARAPDPIGDESAWTLRTLVKQVQNDTPDASAAGVG